MALTPMIYDVGGGTTELRIGSKILTLTGFSRDEEQKWYYYEFSDPKLPAPTSLPGMTFAYYLGVANSTAIFNVDVKRLSSSSSTDGNIRVVYYNPRQSSGNTFNIDIYPVYKVNN